MAKAGSGSGTGGGESAGPVRNFGAGVLLFTTYALFVVCNTVGTACLPSMIEDVGFSAGTGSTIAGFQTAAQAIGKVTFAGRLADALGGRRTYCMSMAVVAVAIACFAWAPSALAIGEVPDVCVANAPDSCGIGEVPIDLPRPQGQPTPLSG